MWPTLTKLIISEAKENELSIEPNIVTISRLNSGAPDHQDLLNQFTNSLMASSVANPASVV